MSGKGLLCVTTKTGKACVEYESITGPKLRSGNRVSLKKKKWNIFCQYSRVAEATILGLLSKTDGQFYSFMQ